MRDENIAPTGSEGNEQKVESNVLEFRPKEKPVERAVEHILHQSGDHATSTDLLKQAGFDSYEAVATKLDSLEDQKKNAIMSISAKIKDRLFNKGQEIDKLSHTLIDLEKQIHDLSRIKRTFRMSAQAEGTFIPLPENTELPGEIKKAA